MIDKLPIECLQKIFSEFSYRQIGENENSFITLYSLALVSRYWCRIANAILWRAPFSWLFEKKEYWDRHYSLISIYFSCLSDESQILLYENGIPLTSALDILPFFDYPTFLTILEYKCLYMAARNWLVKQLTDEFYEEDNDNRLYLLVRELCKLFMSRCTILENISFDDPDNNELKVDFVINLPQLPGAEITLKNLYSFGCVGCNEPEIMFSAANICKLIKVFYIDCCCIDNEGLATLIENQKIPLEGIWFDFTGNYEEFPRIKKALENKGEYLKWLSIRRLNFPLDILGSCTNLSELWLNGNFDISPEILEKFVNFSFPNLKEIHITLISVHIKQIITLINNSHKNIEFIEFLWRSTMDFENFMNYTETIINCCPRLTFYNGFFSAEKISYLPYIFKTCQRLIEFRIGWSVENSCDISEVLIKLGKIVPKNLTRFSLPSNWECTIEALESFLEDCAEKLKKPILIGIYSNTFEHSKLLDRYIKRNVIKDLLPELYPFQ
ncbi:118_t:CDS:1 [Diversispora eburnea]|uniref:118_t:CDS:1 n=1 Tax=Diversispora eburnea TaxID=1213867 RepID=A0A9N8VTQ0_9GLOM|nr:118_t:CDS:1 [Diversispora eburnea]